MNNLTNIILLLPQMTNITDLSSDEKIVEFSFTITNHSAFVKRNRDLTKLPKLPQWRPGERRHLQRDHAAVSAAGQPLPQLQHEEDDPHLLRLRRARPGRLLQHPRLQVWRGLELLVGGRVPLIRVQKSAHGDHGSKFRQQFLWQQHSSVKM